MSNRVMVTTPLPEAMESAYPPKGDGLLGTAAIAEHLTPAPTSRRGQDARRRWSTLKSRAYDQGSFFYDVYPGLCAYVGPYMTEAPRKSVRWAGGKTLPHPVDKFCHASL